MKKSGTEIFKETGDKWTAVSEKIRNLYDAVLKENVPQNLRESSRFNIARSAEAVSIQLENTAEVAASVSASTVETAAGDIVNVEIKTGQGNPTAPLPGSNTDKNKN
jgi:hypothetical protein